MTKPQEPTRHAHQGGEATFHPAFGVAILTRSSNHPGANLFGSDFPHPHTITLTIARAYVGHKDTGDYIHRDGDLLKVEMSEHRWGRFVSSMGQGEGTPCTITRDGSFRVPGIASLPDKSSEMIEQAKERIQIALDNLRTITTEIPEMRLTKADATRLSLLVNSAMLNLTSNLDYVAERFGEHAEEIVEQAKAEVARYSSLAAPGVKTPLLGGDALTKTITRRLRR